MKKLTIIVLSILLWQSMDAQVFSTKSKFDKFDDLVYTKEQKSLISMDEEGESITIEEKGSEPQSYFIVNESHRVGDKDNVVNLTQDVYGYEVSWYVVKSEDKEFVLDIVKSLRDKEISEEEANKKTEDCFLFITHRVITTQFTGTYRTEYWWTIDPKSGSRIIYSKE